MEYPGLDKLHRLESAVDQSLLEKLKERMVPDLRKKLLALANIKLASGALVLSSLGWDMPEREKVKSNTRATGEKVAVQRLGFLMKNYDVQHWYFEILEMIRKLLMACVIALIDSGTSVQIVAALVISILSAVHVQYTRPFYDNKIGNTQTYALLSQSLTLVYGIMLLFREIYSDMLQLPQAVSQEAATNMSAVLVVLMNVGIIAFPFLAMLLSFAWHSCQQWHCGKKTGQQGGSVQICGGRFTKDETPSALPGASPPTAARVRDAKLWSQSFLAEISAAELLPLTGPMTADGCHHDADTAADSAHGCRLDDSAGVMQSSAAHVQERRTLSGTGLDVPIIATTNNPTTVLVIATPHSRDLPRDTSFTIPCFCTTICPCTLLVSYKYSFSANPKSSDPAPKTYPAEP
jgi:membrane protein implicated in regulation of membrane protease activity